MDYEYHTAERLKVVENKKAALWNLFKMDNYRFIEELSLATHTKSPNGRLVGSGGNREAEEIQNVTCPKQFLKRNVYILGGI